MNDSLNYGLPDAAVCITRYQDIHRTFLSVRPESLKSHSFDLESEAMMLLKNLHTKKKSLWWKSSAPMWSLVCSISSRAGPNKMDHRCLGLRTARPRSRAELRTF